MSGQEDVFDIARAAARRVQEAEDEVIERALMKALLHGQYGVLVRRHRTPPDFRNGDNSMSITVEIAAEVSRDVPFGQIHYIEESPWSSD